ncbi:hypothetical protein XELAEV_18022680mg [Xenopus laevis]|uniref:Uncharacterized protein n=1 Tax=Xenopus laevis TaxID=8355 RepID=A0A974HND9_XENLA|nr:hypothetical protein XELAEV_18022680mg [Xenopus laevis]
MKSAVWHALSRTPGRARVPVRRITRVTLPVPVFLSHSRGCRDGVPRTGAESAESDGAAHRILFLLVISIYAIAPALVFNRCVAALCRGAQNSACNCLHLYVSARLCYSSFYSKR